MADLRVYELARQLNVTSNEILAVARAEGFTPRRLLNKGVVGWAGADKSRLCGVGQTSRVDNVVTRPSEVMVCRVGGCGQGRVGARWSRRFRSPRWAAPEIPDISLVV